MPALLTNEDGDQIDIGPSLATLSSPSATAAKVRTAMARVETTIFDQGVAGEITLEAIPHLVRVLRGHATAAAKARVLGLLGAIRQDPGMPKMIALDDAIADGKPAALALLDDRDKGVRLQAAYLAAQLPNTGARLQARIADEKDPIVKATLVYGAALQKRKVPRALVGDKHVVVRTAAALGCLVVDAAALADAGVAAAITRALDDKSASKNEFPFFDLRAEAYAALGRHGARRAEILDLLTARAGQVEDAMHALAAIAVATEDRALIAIVAQLDNGAGALRGAGLELDDLALRRFVGLLPEARPSAIDAALEKKLVALLASKKPYAPEPLVAELARRPAEQRADVAFDLLTMNGIVWDPLEPRPTARVQDLVFRVLTADDISDDRLAREHARLAEIEAKSEAAYRKRVVPRAFVALVIATRSARRKLKLPKALLVELQELPDGNSIGDPRHVRDVLLGPDGPQVAAKIDLQHLHSNGDTSPAALKRLVAAATRDSRSGWTAAIYTADDLQRLIDTYDAKALAPLMKELAKRTYGVGKPIVWNGVAIKTTNRVPNVDYRG
jgi:hypothetical protein